MLTAAISLALMLLPLVRTDTEPGGMARHSLVEQQGWGVAALLAIPLLITVSPLLAPARHRRWAVIGSAVLLTAGALVSAASVGLFYLPSAALLVVAAIRAPKPPR